MSVFVWMRIYIFLRSGFEVVGSAKFKRRENEKKNVRKLRRGRAPPPPFPSFQLFLTSFLLLGSTTGSTDNDYCWKCYGESLNSLQFLCIITVWKYWNLKLQSMTNNLAWFSGPHSSWRSIRKKRISFTSCLQRKVRLFTAQFRGRFFFKCPKPGTTVITLTRHHKGKGSNFNLGAVKILGNYPSPNPV